MHHASGIPSGKLTDRHKQVDYAAILTSKKVHAGRTLQVRPLSDKEIILLRRAFLLLLLTAGPAGASSTTSLPAPQPGKPGTYELASISALRAAPDGAIIDVWPEGARFTSAASAGDWLRITGHFPALEWVPLGEPLWVRREYVQPVRLAPAPPRATPPERYIVVDKSDFTLRVYEAGAANDTAVFTTQVALGMDRCLPKEKGGRCYYTEPGEYKVRWKVHDPEGIEWCIPKSMEDEYADDIARGQRCFRGSIGTHALNIGKSYAIHGTSNPASLGRRVSHGCVRAANGDMRKLYQLMDVGEKVFIVENPDDKATILSQFSGSASPNRP